MNKAPIFHITIAAILSLGAAAIGKAQTRDFPFELTFVNSANADQILPTHLFVPDQRDGSGFRRVSKSSVFYSQERFRIQVQPKQAGYFYVLSRNNQGEVKLLYPLPEDGHNFVRSNTRFSLPNDGWFRFDEDAGREEMILILSSLPLVGVEKAIEDGCRLDDGGPGQYNSRTIVVRHIFLDHQER